MNREEANQLKVTQLNDRLFRSHLEDCLAFGKPMLIENIEEELDPVLDPVLERRVIKKVCLRSAYTCVCEAAHINVCTTLLQKQYFNRLPIHPRIAILHAGQDIRAPLGGQGGGLHRDLPPVLHHTLAQPPLHARAVSQGELRTLTGIAYAGMAEYCC
eukprot:scaffold18048_cov19-Tisochrysis_lutea.AAC.6